MFTNFDCSAFYVKDRDQLENTFRLVPPYLESQKSQKVNDFSNLGIQLGRRFRALKLWFVIRNFGVEGIQAKIRGHIQLAQQFEDWIQEHSYFELLVPRSLSVVCFRLKIEDETLERLNDLNREFMELLNRSGGLFLSHTIISGKYSLRFVCAQTNTEEKHVRAAMQKIEQTARSFIKNKLR
jgi:aromatic-L-amino-acid decarboxylase